MEKTINQIKEELNEIAVQHRQINHFYFGNFIDAISGDAVDYTLMNATLQQGSFGENYVEIPLSITVCDKYNEGNNRQIDEVHSDCLRILRDIYVIFKQQRFQEYLDITAEPQPTPFINKGHDITAGWSMDLILKIYDDENWCAIPMDDYDFGN